MLFVICVCIYQVFLLPDRGTKSKRRTKTLANTCEPRWGQTFVYTGLRRCDLNGRYLEVTFFREVQFLILIGLNFFYKNYKI